MTINDVWQQAQELTPEDRRKLAKRLIESLQLAEESKPDLEQEPLGQRVIALLNDMDLTDWESMEIDDVSEWVRQIRQQQTDRLASHWSDEE